MLLRRACQSLVFPSKRILPLCHTMSTTSPAAADASETLFNTENNVGLITLNRPKVFNALSMPMVQQIYPRLKAWQDEGQMRLVIMEGAGEKAFCAGGDIRTITDVPNKGTKEQAEFFRQEYHLDHLIGTLGDNLPFVALIDGITMGGGVGLSVHGLYRVATERTVFAMPETGIGLVPDVGGGFFLPRLPGQLGMFLALTGHRLKGSDCLHAGVATHMCPAEQIGQLKRDLIEDGGQDVEAVLAKYTEAFPLTDFSLQDRLATINRCFAADSVESIHSCLNNGGDEWCSKTAKAISRQSPTSLKVAFRQLREGAKMTYLAECLRMEYRLVRRCCEDHDFYEGVRAIIVDKDNKPQWKPDRWGAVTKKHVDRYFSPLPNGDELDL